MQSITAATALAVEFRLFLLNGGVSGGVIKDGVYVSVLRVPGGSATIIALLLSFSVIACTFLSCLLVMILYLKLTHIFG